MDRRNFIERLVRGGFLALLALVTGLLFTRRQVTGGRECPGIEVCRNCGKLERCERPEAAREKDEAQSRTIKG